MLFSLTHAYCVSSSVECSIRQFDMCICFPLHFGPKLGAFKSERCSHDRSCPYVRTCTGFWLQLSWEYQVSRVGGALNSDDHDIKWQKGGNGMLLHGDGYHFLSFPVGQRCRHARNTSNILSQDTFTRSWSWLASKHINPKFRPENRADNALENSADRIIAPEPMIRLHWCNSFGISQALETCNLKLIEIKLHLESQRQRPSSRAHTSDPAKTSFSIISTLQVSHVFTSLYALPVFPEVSNTEFCSISSMVRNQGNNPPSAFQLFLTRLLVLLC